MLSPPVPSVSPALMPDVQPGPNGVCQPDVSSESTTQVVDPENLEEEEVQVDQRALVNILARYPGPFDVLRELIQNADDAEAHNIEIHFESEKSENPQSTSKPDTDIDDAEASDIGTPSQPVEEEAEESQPTNEPDVDGFETSFKVAKWIIKNDGKPFEQQDWERLGKIAYGNKNSSKVGAFGVGFYSVLSKSDKPLVKSNGKFLRFQKGEEDGKLRKSSGTCPTDSWTSIELELRESTQLSGLIDLTRFLVSSVAFLANVNTISIYLDNERVLHIQRDAQAPTDIQIPQHLNPTTSSEVLTVESIRHTVQKLTVEAADCVLASRPIPTSISSDDEPDEVLMERPGRPDGGRPKRTFGSSKATLKDNTITHDLYTAITRVDLSKNLQMKEGVESSLKSLPESFQCKAVYFNSEQCLSGVINSETPKTKQLASLLCGPQGIFTENERHAYYGRLFIGQSTTQTTGIGLHVSAHFLPTMERSSIDLANGQVRVWNKEVLSIAGFLARVIYEQEMERVAVKPKDHATHLGLCTMARFPFSQTAPHSGVSQILQNAFFSCHQKTEKKAPFPVVSNHGISCASLPKLRQGNKDLLFLKTYRVFHDEIEQSQRSEIVKRYGTPPFKFKDIVDEFEAGAAQEVLKSFFAWWEDERRNAPSTLSARKARKMFCERFASRGVLQLKERTKIVFKDIKYFTFFQLPNDLTHPNNFYIDVSANRPSRESLECFGWNQLPLLVWLEHVCSLAPTLISNGDSDVGYRILRVLMQFALVEDLYREQWVQVAELMNGLKCIPTNKGRELPNKSYFGEADVCRYLPVAEEESLTSNQPTSAATEYGFEPRFVDLRHVRGVLTLIRVRAMMDWKDLVARLEGNASEETNYRLLQYLILHFRKLTEQQWNDFKEKKIFCSERHGRLSGAELILANEHVRKLDLPVLALPRNGMADLQNVTEQVTMGLLDAGRFIEELGIRAHPTLEKIIELAASDRPDIRQNALQYLLSNLDICYSNYKSDNYKHVAFIPTECGSLAPPNEVFASPIWKKLGFKQASEMLCRDLSRLGVKDHPSIDIITKRFETPEITLPDIPTAKLWFEYLYLYGKLSTQELREQLSTIRFVPVKNPDSSSADPSALEYISPKECFVGSAETKEHHRRIFPFVDFGSNGNSFLESCCARKTPDASDIARKIAKDPKKYLEASGTGTDRYLDDLRTIASRLESLSAEDKQAMRDARMFLPFRHGAVARELLLANQVLISDWEGRAFDANVNMAPKEDVLAKMYSEMGSEFLGAYVRYDVVPTKGKRGSMFTREEVILRIQCFMKEQDKRAMTGVSFDDQDSRNKLEVGACEAIEVTKTFEPPEEALADPAGTRTITTKPFQVKAGCELKADGYTYTLWTVGGHNEPGEVHNHVAIALCRVLLKTYSPNDLLLVARLFRMSDEDLKMCYFNETPRQSSDSPTKELKLPVPRRIAHLFEKFADMKFEKKTKTVRERITTIEDDVREAIESLAVPDPKGKLHDVFARRKRPPLNIKRSNKYCKQAHAITLNEKEHLRDEATGIRFFMAWGTKWHPDECDLKKKIEEFAKLVSELALVFGKVDFTACFFIFWKDTDQDLMAFNRDQKYIFLNLANYHNFFCDKEMDRVKVVLEWYLIMAHEIAHNKTMEHDEYHGLLAAKLAIEHYPQLQERLLPHAENGYSPQGS